MTDQHSEVNTDKLFNQLKYEAQYALNSKSKHLVYQAYGRVTMARELDMISADQFTELNEILITNGLNASHAIKWNIK